jgi:hypothetical protein
MEDGVQRTICADAKGTRCHGEIVDMFALSLGDFLIIANSTFSWWSHFFRHCIRHLSDWLLVDTETHALERKIRSAASGTVFPHRWYLSRISKDRQKIFDFVTSDILVPSPSKLFEDVPKAGG